MKPYPLALLNHLTVPFRRSTYPRFLHVPSTRGEGRAYGLYLYDAFWSDRGCVSRASQRSEVERQKCASERHGPVVSVGDAMLEPENTGNGFSIADGSAGDHADGRGQRHQALIDDFVCFRVSDARAQAGG